MNLNKIGGTLTNVTAIGIAATFFQVVIKLILARYYVPGATELSALI